MKEAAARARTEPKVHVVGRYALYDEIASGGMATVYFGRLLGPVGFSRIVAVKRMHPHHAKDPQLAANFLDEARLVSRVHHPNVVPTLDVVRRDDELLLVMEYVQGESLARLFRAAITRKEPVPVRVALAIMTNVLHGLHAAHEATSEAGEPLDIVHRDVSPQNVMVGVDGVARVCDFGIARAAVRAESTEEGVLKGKISYMAPEQLGGAPVDRRADVYAAAVMLWELFCGRKLWGTGDAHAALLDKVSRVVDRPSMHRDDVPDALDAIVLHGLEREADKRFATAREFALALEQYGPLAPASEVGAWVERLAKDALAARAQRVGGYESQPAPAAQRGASAPAVEELRTVAANPVSAAMPIARPTSERPAPPQMRSDTYPVLRAVKRPERERASLRPSRIFEEVHAFAPWRRRVARTAQGLAAGLALAALGLGGRAAMQARGERSDAATRGEMIAAPALAAGATAAGRCPAGTALVPAGRLFAGDDDGAPSERPAHQVNVSAFCIDLTEVTVAAYHACSDRGDCKRATITNDWEGMGAAEARAFDAFCNAREPRLRAAHPMNCVSWDLAAGYCAANGKRLPTEAEWEYAARGSDGRRYPWGDEPPDESRTNACGKECSGLGKQAHLPLEPLHGKDDGWPASAPVGSFPGGKSRFGALDLAGNVGEWTADWFGPYPEGPLVDPKGPAQGKARVVRGGGWSTSVAAQLRPTSRQKAPPDKRAFWVGFRCAVAATP